MKTTAEKIAVMQAYEDGKTIETHHISLTKWKTDRRPCWNWGLYDYRVKPEPREWWIVNGIAYPRGDRPLIVGEVIKVREVLE